MGMHIHFTREGCNNMSIRDGTLVSLPVSCAEVTWRSMPCISANEHAIGVTKKLARGLIAPRRPTSCSGAVQERVRRECRTDVEVHLSR